jgi:hypothetical protein
LNVWLTNVVDPVIGLGGELLLLSPAEFTARAFLTLRLHRYSATPTATAKTSLRAACRSRPAASQRATVLTAASTRPRW